MLVLHILAHTAHSSYGVIKAGAMPVYSGSLLLSFLCLLQASIIKLFLYCWGINFFLIFLLGYETKIKFYVGV